MTVEEFMAANGSADQGAMTVDDFMSANSATAVAEPPVREERLEDIDDPYAVAAWHARQAAKQGVSVYDYNLKLASDAEQANRGAITGSAPYRIAEGAVNAAADAFVNPLLAAESKLGIDAAGDMLASRQSRADRAAMVDRGWLERTTSGIANSLSQAFSLAATGGLPAMLTSWGTQSYQNSYREAKKIGASDKEAGRMARANAAVETAVMGTFQMLGLGGLEQTILKGAGWQGVRKFVASTAAELGEEHITAVAQSLASKGDLSEANAIDVTIQTIGSMGLVAGSQKLKEFIQNPSRYNAKRAGVDELATNRAERAELAAGIEAAAVEESSKRSQNVAKVPQSSAPAETVRFYHGGVRDGSDKPAWLTPDQQFAESYAAKTPGGKVFYIDLPADSPLLSKAFDDSGTDTVAPYVNFEVPADVASGLQEVGPPPTTTDDGAPPPTTSDDPLTAAKREFVDLDRALLGLEEIPDAETQTWAENLLNAKSEGIPARAVDIAAEILNKPRSLSPDETAGFTIRMTEIKNAHEELSRQLEGAADADIATRGAEIDRLETEFDQLTRAVRTSGTIKGRTLAAQKLTINRSYDLVSVVTRAKAAKGADVTTLERGKLKKLTDDFAVEQKKIADLENKLAEAQADLATVQAGGTINRQRQRRYDVMSEQRDKLHYELNKTRAEIRRTIAGMRPASRLQKYFVKPMQTVRQLVTSGDFPPVFRQGGIITFSNPARSARAAVSGMRAMFSDRAAHKAEQDIAARSNAPLYERSGLYIAKREGGLDQKEEAFISGYAERILGVRQIIKASERNYVTFLNQLRADTFDVMAETLAIDGQPTDAEYKAIADYINVATGRGAFNQNLNGAMANLSAVFFSPRYVASRFQYLAGQPLYGGTARTRKLIAKEYAKTLLGISVVAGLAVAAGADWERDPRSSDWGKLMLGDTRIDAAAGLAQTATVTARTADALKRTLQWWTGGGKRKKGEFKDDTAVIMDFLRQKFSPTIGAPIDLVTGKTVVHEDVTPGVMAQTLALPISFRDLKDTLEEHGVPAGTALFLVSLFGAGVNTYDNKK